MITLPREWIKKNNLLPKTDLEITESGPSLIISPETIHPELSPQIVSCDNLHEELLISKITSLYREGCSEIKLVNTDNNTDAVNRAYKFALNLFGVAVEQKENAIIMRTAEGAGKRPEILNKCFHNLLLLSEMACENQGTAGWEKQIFEIYERIYFLTEYLFRMVALEGSSDFSNSLKEDFIASYIQTIAEILKKAAEVEHEHALNEFFGGASPDLKNLIRTVYDVCMLKREPGQFYEIRNQIIQKVKEKKYNTTCAGYAHMCEYFCTKLVRMESKTGTEKGAITQPPA